MWSYQLSLDFSGNLERSRQFSFNLTSEMGLTREVFIELKISF